MDRRDLEIKQKKGWIEGGLGDSRGGLWGLSLRDATDPTVLLLQGSKSEWFSCLLALEARGGTMQNLDVERWISRT